ncbi:MAG: hypothetical protein KIT79_01160 [Deltaproteobacteria bacterium]|nr:hypothetical protein [Deltaproteobacteria bacterium]
MKLPNGDRAIIDIRKLTGYCLNPDHPTGKHKARQFEVAAGITAQNAGSLRDALAKAAFEREAITVKTNEYGVFYQIDLDFPGPAGPVRVRSAWIINRGENDPRLVTCFVLR